MNIVNSTTQNTGGIFHIKAMNGHLNISSDLNKTNLISIFDAQTFGSLLYSINNWNFYISLY